MGTTFGDGEKTPPNYTAHITSKSGDNTSKSRVTTFDGTTHRTIQKLILFFMSVQLLTKTWSSCFQNSFFVHGGSEEKKNMLREGGGGVFKSKNSDPGLSQKEKKTYFEGFQNSFCSS